MTAAVAEGRACPGFLLCPDDVTWFANGTNSWSVIGEPGSTPVTHSMNMDLRFGQTLDRTWNAWQNQHPTPKTNADSEPGNDPPYHHDCHNDWKDYVNFKYWEPYTAVIPYIHTTKATYRRWSNGTDELKPDFKSAGYQAAVYGTPVSISTLGADGLMPELHAAAANTLGEIVFKITLPFEITDANISGDFVRTGGSDIARLFISTNGSSFTQIWDHTGLGSTHVDNLNVRSTVFGLFTYYIKVQVRAWPARPTPASTTWSSAPSSSTTRALWRTWIRASTTSPSPSTTRPNWRPAAPSSGSPTSGRNTTVPAGPSPRATSSTC